MKKRLTALLAGVLVVAAGGFGSQPVSAAPTPPAPIVSPDTALPPAAALLEASVKQVAGNPPTPKPNSKPVKGGVYAAKGKAPAKAGASAATSSTFAGPTVYFIYNNAIQTPPANTFVGGTANFTVQKTFMDTGDYHTLVELAIQDAAQQNTVEIGITTDRVVNGGCTPQPACKDDPYLFGFHWKNGQGTCYNACGFVDYDPNDGVYLGMNVSAHIGTSKQLLIQYFNGNWWLSYGGTWVGYYPGSLWTTATPPVTTFTSVGHAKLFGEIAAAKDKPCTDMGNGYLGTAANHATSATPAGRIGSWSLITSNGTNVLSGPVSTPNTTPGYAYISTALSVRTFVLGGPGWNAAGTGAGTRNAC